MSGLGSRMTLAEVCPLLHSLVSILLLIPTLLLIPHFILLLCVNIALYVWVNSRSNMPMFCPKKLISQPRG